MSEPTDDKIQRQAKELCWRDGKAWSLDEFQNGVSGVTMFTVVADATERVYYLNRAKKMLDQTV